MAKHRNSSIIAIQHNKHKEKLLLYFDPEWGFWMFPSCKMIDSDDIKEYIAGELRISPNDVWFEFTGTASETKYATAHDEVRTYRYYVHIGHVRNVPEDDFTIGNRHYRWMTLDDLLLEESTKENNEYLVKTAFNML